MSRHFWVLVHRYAGLTMAGFLTVVGLSGSILAFRPELDAWLKPPYSVAVQAQPMLSPLVLRERALRLAPHTRINAVDLQPKPGIAFMPNLTARTDPATQQPYPLKPLHLNPYNGEPIAMPETPAPTGYWPLTRHNILAFIYELHYSLVLGDIGLWLFGITATLWTADCFIGFYLTLPMRRKQPFAATPIATGPTLANFWQRWQIAWKIKWPSSKQRLHFDLHRAGGLWLWPLLLIFAWSGVAFNLNAAVYRPVMQALFEMTDFDNFPAPNLAQPRPDPALDFTAAYQSAQRLMAEQARLKGFTVRHEQAFSYHPANGLYQYTVLSDRDVSAITGASHLYIDGDNGKLVRLFLPTGEKSGDTVTVWLVNLHTAQLWGLPYKLFVCLFGWGVAMLAMTGVYLWLKKRQAAQAKQKPRTAMVLFSFRALLDNLKQL
ncbi:PepSY-associated TM helix domain-containing protein [Methylovulum psychrotolerans]|uniref:PepSY domain-containing protein n=1 Tax=Methylovulum psychrotolerans TaxID=1704499 RepID=A0A2S5CKC0_9GAMM|nr:PepSY-associated TM helix domain-containing protein [Methylovulum psychrotolerans]POZ51261.1 PepSY domain-containing protein [Methylovulum psychrotolerans]